MFFVSVFGLRNERSHAKIERGLKIWSDFRKGRMQGQF